MKPKVIPLVDLKLNWDFLGTLQAAGFRPTRRLDDSKIKVGDFQSYLLALYYIRHPDGVPPKDALKDLGQIMDHLFFSFFIEADKEVISEIYRRATLSTISLDTTRTTEVIIASGSLTQWHAAILEFCSLGVDERTRMLFDAIILMFERAGLRGLWSNYRKIKQDDGFILEQK